MSAPVDAGITVERQSDRVLIVVERRRRRTLNLGLDEAALLAELLRRELPAVSVHQVPRPRSAR